MGRHRCSRQRLACDVAPVEQQQGGDELAKPDLVKLRVDEAGDVLEQRAEAMGVGGLHSDELASRRLAVCVGLDGGGLRLYGTPHQCTGQHLSQGRNAKAGHGPRPVRPLKAASPRASSDRPQQDPK